MAVDAAYILAISRGKYTVGSAETDTIPQTTLTLFLAWALDQISLDLPGGGLTTTQLEQAEGLLVLHYIELENFDKTSESIDNYSYSRKEAGSPWFAAYQKLIYSIKQKAGSAIFAANLDGVTRSDSDIMATMGYSSNE
jgi:hypothetical protein